MTVDIATAALVAGTFFVPIIRAGRRFRVAAAGDLQPAVRGLLACAAAGLCVATASASASISVATGVQRPALRVDARGTAEISWSQGGVRRTLLFPRSGRVLPGGRLSGADVSRAATAPIPFRKAMRRAPDGTLYALQAWAPTAGRTELRFARWKGAPMKVSLSTEPSGASEVVVGTATFAGTPVTGYAVTPEGKRIRVHAFVDCLCGGVWKRIGGVATRADGSFSLFVKAGFRAPRYRAIVTGPTRGTTHVPDGMAVAASS